MIPQTLENPFGFEAYQLPHMPSFTGDAGKMGHVNDYIFAIGGSASDNIGKYSFGPAWVQIECLVTNPAFATKKHLAIQLQVLAKLLKDESTLLFANDRQGTYHLLRYALVATQGLYAKRPESKEMIDHIMHDVASVARRVVDDEQDVREYFRQVQKGMARNMKEGKYDEVLDTLSWMVDPNDQLFGGSLSTHRRLTTAATVLERHGIVLAAYAPAKTGALYADAFLRVADTTDNKLLEPTLHILSRGACKLRTHSSSRQNGVMHQMRKLLRENKPTRFGVSSFRPVFCAQARSAPYPHYPRMTLDRS
jgi:hypothetical protein